MNKVMDIEVECQRMVVDAGGSFDALLKNLTAELKQETRASIDSFLSIPALRREQLKPGTQIPFTSEIGSDLWSAVKENIQQVESAWRSLTGEIKACLKRIEARSQSQASQVIKELESRDALYFAMYSKARTEFLDIYNEYERVRYRSPDWNNKVIHSGLTDLRAPGNLHRELVDAASHRLP